MILDADGGNVARAHVKIKPIALSRRQGYRMVMAEKEQEHREMLRKALTFVKLCLTGQHPITIMRREKGLLGSSKMAVN